jgi:hypothetical protein
MFEDVMAQVEVVVAQFWRIWWIYKQVRERVMAQLAGEVAQCLKIGCFIRRCNGSVFEDVVAQLEGVMAQSEDVVAQLEGVVAL